MASKTKKRGRKRSQVPPSSQRRRVTARARPVVARTPPAAQPGARRVLNIPPRRLYAYAVGVAVLLATLLIGLSQMSAHQATNRGTSQPSGTSGVADVGETAALLKGIPQHGNLLGSSKAPVRLIEYADPQCPYCAMYALNVLPTLIRKYVRPGKVQLVFRGLWFLGQDSGTALTTATAAGAQNRFWNVIDLLYRNQGPENAWVNDGLLRSILNGAGADANRVFATRSSRGVVSTVDRWSTLARNEGVNSVPAFFLGRRGGPTNRVVLQALAVPEFQAALDQALKG